MGNIHSKVLSPSRSFIWLNCPYSEFLSDLIPLVVLKKRDSSYIKRNKAAIQGVVAHKVAEAILKKQYKRDEFFRDFHINKDYTLVDSVKHALTAESSEIAAELTDNYKLLKTDMETFGYRLLDLVEKEYNDLLCDDFTPIVRIEDETGCSHYAKNCIGTPDVYVLGKNQLTVFDYKYGKMDVEPKNNTQLMIYALGIIEHYMNFVPELQTVKMVVYQPRCGGEKTWATSVKELTGWGSQVLYPAAKKALDPYYREAVYGEEWCEYCNYKIFCEAYLKEKYGYNNRLNDLVFRCWNTKDKLERMSNIRDRLTSSDFVLPEESNQARELLVKTSENSNEIKDRISKIEEKYDLEYFRERKAAALLDVEYSNEVKNAVVYALIDDDCYSIKNLTDLKTMLLYMNEDRIIKEPIVLFNKLGQWTALINGNVSETGKTQIKLEDAKLSKINIAGSTYCLVPEETYKRIKTCLSDYTDLIDQMDSYKESYQWALEVYNAVNECENEKYEDLDDLFEEVGIDDLFEEGELDNQ